MSKTAANGKTGLIKSTEEIDIMRRAGRALGAIRDEVAENVAPGVTTADLDEIGLKRIRSIGAEPAFLGYHGFPATICASIDEEIVHGIPSTRRKLREGELISIDIGLKLEGYYADSAVTVPVGEVSPEIKHLIDTTRRALEVGINEARPGKRLGDVSHAIEQVVKSENLAVVREYTGHGIGTEMHEEPKIPNYGPAGKGLRLCEGMVMALEPMVNPGTWKTQVLEDGWTVVTQDRKPSAHFEHTIALHADGAEILTKRG